MIDEVPLYLRVEPAALSEERAGDEPEAVAHAKLVLDDVAFGETGVGVVPLVGAESSHHEEGEADQHVRGQHVQPDLDGQRVHEGEQPRWLAGWHLNYVTLRF